MISNTDINGTPVGSNHRSSTNGMIGLAQTCALSIIKQARDDYKEVLTQLSILEDSPDSDPAESDSLLQKASELETFFYSRWYQILMMDSTRFEGSVLIDVVQKEVEQEARERRLEAKLKKEEETERQRILDRKKAGKL